MKAALVLVALCLVAANAGTINHSTVEYEVMVDDVLSEVEQITKDAAAALQHQIEEIVLAPLQQVETAVESIEARRDESDVCVAAQDENVAATVDAMHKEMGVCGVVAAKTSADIMTDISAATQQLVFEGYDVVKTNKRCQKYKNSVLKSSCYARLTVKATLYLKNARKSIKTIKQSTNERIPAVMTAADTCTHTAANTALHQMDNINTTIDVCISKF